MNSFLSLQTTCVLLLWHFFCLADSSDEECQTWLPPEPTHLWPWPYQPWHSQLKQIPCFLSGLFGCYNEQWGRWGVCWLLFCLPTVSTVLRIVPLAAFAELDELWEICQQEVARRVHISTFLLCWIKPIGSDNARPANTDLFLNSVLSNTICQETGTYKGGILHSITKHKHIYICILMNPF